MASALSLLVVMAIAFYIGRLFGERSATIVEREKFLKVLRSIKTEDGLHAVAKYHVIYIRTLITKKLQEEWWK
jgi:uncharacterized membrane protein YdjX (TVP38/TMEM64 family)